MAKGQTALEYLVTYGWAILGIIIIVGVLISFGVFNPSKWANVRQQGGFSSLAVLDHSMTSGAHGMLTLSLQNTRGNSIIITSVVTMSGGCSYTGSKLLTTENPVTIPTGDCNQSTVIDATPGSAYDFADLAITYTDTTSSLVHTERGFIKGQFQ
ncbi:MAG: hypothetical protein WC408_06615 [Candidatus Micrarchaeia archaeon]